MYHSSNHGFFSVSYTLKLSIEELMNKYHSITSVAVRKTCIKLQWPYIIIIIYNQLVYKNSVEIYRYI